MARTQGAPIVTISGRPRTQPGDDLQPPERERLSGRSTSRTLLLTAGEERELIEVDGLVAGAAMAGPASEDGLEEQHRLWQCQAGRGAFGSSRSRVRKACAQVTSAVWWWKPR